MINKIPHFSRTKPSRMFPLMPNIKISALGMHEYVVQHALVTANSIDPDFLHTYLSGVCTDKIDLEACVTHVPIPPIEDQIKIMEIINNSKIDLRGQESIILQLILLDRTDELKDLMQHIILFNEAVEAIRAYHDLVAFLDKSITIETL